MYFRNGISIESLKVGIKSLECGIQNSIKRSKASCSIQDDIQKDQESQTYWIFIPASQLTIQTNND